ncbi:MAG TPA: methyltransferase dimerization domain-containing protein, partial [Actinopolymorphaceae bacterium]|nr:methyltransferase dimerization domain-containing protein [Actinopolymorphaceae bacterium]
MSSPDRPTPAPTTAPPSAPTPPSAAAPPPPLAPAERVLQLMMGAWVSQTTFVLARLGIPDVLAERPRSAHEVAQAIGTHPDGTARLLRAAGTVGLVSESPDGYVQLTEMGDCLRSDTLGSMREQALAFGTPTKWRLAG